MCSLEGEKIRQRQSFPTKNDQLLMLTYDKNENIY